MSIFCFWQIAQAQSVVKNPWTISKDRRYVKAQKETTKKEKLEMTVAIDAKSNPKEAFIRIIRTDAGSKYFQFVSILNKGKDSRPVVDEVFWYVLEAQATHTTDEHKNYLPEFALEIQELSPAFKIFFTPEVLDEIAKSSVKPEAP